MSTVQANLLDKDDNKVVPNTTTAAVYDAAKEQALSATLEDTPDRRALGYPAFSTITSYAAGNVVFHGGALWRFNQNHLGAWNDAHVDAFDIKTLLDELVETIEDGAIGTVVAAAFAYLKAEVDGLKASLHDANVLLDAAFASLDAGSYKVCGLPRVLRSKVAGAPSAANVPDNWDPATMGVWTGVPRSTEQLYMDQASKKVYAAPVLTNSTNDWVVLN